MSVTKVGRVQHGSHTSSQLSLLQTSAGSLGPGVTKWLATGLYHGKAPAMDCLCSISQEEPSSRLTTTQVELS